MRADLVIDKYDSNKNVMHIVFKTVQGEILWDEKLEVESLESFVETRNRRVREMGSQRDVYFLDSPHRVIENFWDGRIKGHYYICEKDVNRMV